MYPQGNEIATIQHCTDRSIVYGGVDSMVEKVLFFDERHPVVMTYQVVVVAAGRAATIAHGVSPWLAQYIAAGFADKHIPVWFEDVDGRN